MNEKIMIVGIVAFIIFAIVVYILENHRKIGLMFSKWHKKALKGKAKANNQ